MVYRESSIPLSHGASATKFLLSAVRSDGSTMVGPAEPESPLTRDLVLISEKQTVLVSDVTKRKSTQRIVDPRLRQLSSDPQCAPSDLVASQKAQLIGVEVLAGVSSFRYDFSSTNPSEAAIRRSFWYAPSLGCQLVQGVEERLDVNGNVLTRFERKPVSITVGEPEARHFAVPRDFEEVPPSTLMRGSMGAYSQTILSQGGPKAPPESASVKQLYDRLDARYRQYRIE
jgi:hypothetical protein